jgi:hypothetical protein
VNLPDIPPPPPVPTSHCRRWKVSQIYCGLSLFVAVLAIVTATSPTVSLSAGSLESNQSSLNHGSDGFWVRLLAPRTVIPPEPPKPKAPAWIRWILPKEEEPVVVEKPQWGMWMIDPVLFQPQPLTDLLDKILTSTPRLLAIANLLLSITYLVHTAIANLFLDLPSLSRESWSGRERLGGFLVFKLLLISAVACPRHPRFIDFTLMVYHLILPSFPGWPGGRHYGSYLSIGTNASVLEFCVCCFWSSCRTFYLPPFAWRSFMGQDGVWCYS